MSENMEGTVFLKYLQYNKVYYIINIFFCFNLSKRNSQSYKNLFRKIEKVRSQKYWHSNLAIIVIVFTATCFSFDFII